MASTAIRTRRQGCSLTVGVGWLPGRRGFCIDISNMFGFHYCFLLKGLIWGAPCHSALWMWVPPHSPNNIWHNTCPCYSRSPTEGSRGAWGLGAGCQVSWDSGRGQHRCKNLGPLLTFFPCEIYVEKREREAPLKERSRDVVSPFLASRGRQVGASLLAGREEAMAGRRKPDKTQAWVALGERAKAGMFAQCLALVSLREGLMGASTRCLTFRKVGPGTSSG